MGRLTVLMPLGALALVAALVVAILAYGTSPQTGAPRRNSAPGVAPTSELPAARSVDPSVCASPLGPGADRVERVFHPDYTQRRDVLGLTIVANARVSAEALDVAEETLRDIFANNDLEAALAAEGAYIVVADGSQGILDIPEFRCLAESDRSFSHVCGVADHADFPVATVNELDLLGRGRGPCGGLNVLYHEVGHLVQGWTITPADAIDIRFLYQDALNEGKYEGAYANTNANEYFAEGTQAYFFHGFSGEDASWLRGYDPGLYAVLERLYGPRD